MALCFLLSATGHQVAYKEQSEVIKCL